MTISVSVVAVALLIALTAILLINKKAAEPDALPQISGERQAGIDLQGEKDRHIARPAQMESTARNQDGSRQSGVANAQNSAGSHSGNSTFDSPESVVRAYLSAVRWQERIPCVANAATVRSLMEETYEPTTIFGKRTARLQPNKWSKAKIQAATQHSDGTLHVIVDMTGVDEEPIWEYVVVKETDGYKVDWVASQDLRERRTKERLIQNWRLENAVLKAKVLKLDQSEGGNARLTIEVTNNSKAFLSFWEVDASVFDRAGAFLANDMTVDQNIRPGDSSVRQITFPNVNFRDIGRWVLRLKGANVENENGERLTDADKYFTFREIKE